MDGALPISLAYDEVANKIGLSLTIGLLVGLEREWAQKEVGVRTFAVTTLLGTLSALLGTMVVAFSLLGTLLLVALLNVQSLLRDRSLELTTSAALMVMLLLGAVVGNGHFFTAAAAAILLTMLLAWKVELARFADALHPIEIRGAVLLGLLTFVILPLLPNRFIDPYDLVNPRQAWVTVVVIAGVGFVNYVLLRVFSARGLVYAAVLGGMVNSTAAVVELAASFGKESAGRASRAVALLMLTNIAMFGRNLVLLSVFAPSAMAAAALPLGAMAAAAAAVTYLCHHAAQTRPAPQLQLSSPVSLLRVLKFGTLFVGLAVAGTLAQRLLGNYGFIALSAVGGIISSASATATAASLVELGRITPRVAAAATVAAAVASAVVNLPLVFQQCPDRRLLRELTLATLFIIACGGGALAAGDLFGG